MEENRCPICGGRLFRPYSLQDSVICGQCADDLRFAYPPIYLTRVGLLDEDPRCQDLRRKDLTYLKKHRQESTVYAGGRDVHVYRFDPMSLLDLAAFREQLLSADARENRIRQDYQDYTNVLPVEFARPLRKPIGKPGIQNIRRRKTGFAATGFIRAGTFREGDMVWILHEGTRRYADILALDYEELTVAPEQGDLRTRYAEDIAGRGELGTAIRAGYQVTMILSDRAEGIGPGDLIVSD